MLNIVDTGFVVEYADPTTGKKQLVTFQETPTTIPQIKLYATERSAAVGVRALERRLAKAEGVATKILPAKFCFGPTTYDGPGLELGFALAKEVYNVPYEFTHYLRHCVGTRSAQLQYFKKFSTVLQVWTNDCKYFWDRVPEKDALDEKGYLRLGCKVREGKENSYQVKEVGENSFWPVVGKAILVLN